MSRWAQLFLVLSSEAADKSDEFDKTRFGVDSDRSSVISVSSVTALKNEDGSGVEVINFPNGKQVDSGCQASAPVVCFLCRREVTNQLMTPRLRPASDSGDYVLC